MSNCNGEKFEFGEWALKIPQIPPELDDAPNQDAWAEEECGRRVKVRRSRTVLVRNDENNRGAGGSQQ